MIKGKRGNIFFGVVLGLGLFVAGTLFIPFIADDITTARTALSCSSPTTITGGTMLLCLTVDIVVPYFILFFVSVALGFIAGRN